MSTNGIGKSYDEFLQTIKSRGLKTTSLGNGEANFADYANALSGSLKEELLQSIGDEAGDSQLQAKVASLFGGKSVLQHGEVMQKAKAAGLTCTVEYKKTSYIIDNKQDGHYDKDVTNGSIAIYTFSDGNSTIKIADSNGNGALEAEEIFLNEILGDVTNDISATGFNANGGTTNAIDVAKMQQQKLLEQIEKSRENQQEIMKQIKELQEGIEEATEDKEEDKTTGGVSAKSNEDLMSKEDFEAKVLSKALENYADGSSGSIRAVELALNSIKGDYELGFNVEDIDVVELAKKYAEEKEKQEKEK